MEKSKKADEYKIAVGIRLKNFLLSKFETVNKAAEYLGTSGNSLRTSYFNGTALPGGKLIFGLIKLGCDIGWLLDDKDKGTDLPANVNYQNKQYVLYVKELEKELYKVKEENIILKKKVTEISKLGLRITEYTEDKE